MTNYRLKEYNKSTYLSKYFLIIKNKKVEGHIEKEVIVEILYWY